MADVRLAGIGMTSARTRDRLVQRLREQGIRSPEVLDRIRNVPRHIFVDEALASRAYEDTALPIGHGQTISQPYIVARMTEALLEGGPLFNVLEVGTEGRMNYPGRGHDNWLWRYAEGELQPSHEEFLLGLARAYGRA